VAQVVVAEPETVTNRAFSGLRGLATVRLDTLLVIWVVGRSVKPDRIAVALMGQGVAEGEVDIWVA
jgi:hypothetical protein